MVDAYMLAGMGHILGAVLGVGGATISDVLFFKSIKDKKITKDELAMLSAVSKVIWTGLVILILSGLSFLTIQYMNNGSVPVLQSTKFQAKLVMVLVILINGIVFHTKVIPFLRKNTDKDMRGKEFSPKLWLLGATGAISIVSWYTVFVFGMLRGIPLPTWAILGIYVVVVLCAIVFAKMTLARSLGSKNEKEFTAVNKKRTKAKKRKN